MIEEAQNDTKQHLSYAQDDGHLHLVGVGKDQLVFCILPNLSGGRRGGGGGGNHVKSCDVTS